MVRGRHLDAEPAGNFVAHARIAVFQVVGAWRIGLPQPVQLARQAAGGTHYSCASAEAAVHRSDHLRLGRIFGVGRGRHPVGIGEPLRAPLASFFHPVVRSAMRAKAGGEHPQPGIGVAKKRQGTVLRRVEKLRVESNDCFAVVLEQCPRPGSEILQARANRENHIGLLGQSVCGRGAVDADRAHVKRMVGRKRGFAACVSATGIRWASANSFRPLLAPE